MVTLEKAESKTRRRARRKTWRFSWLSLLMYLLLVAAASVYTYPYAAQWVSQYNMSNIIVDQSNGDKSKGRNVVEEQISLAQLYNTQLSAGGVLEGGANLAEGTGVHDGGLAYREMLSLDPHHVMARLRIPVLSLDLPVYHGTSDEVLLKGIGHLEGTSLPVGGEGTRAVLTGHRGLANAEIFTNLNKVKVGDRFVVEVLGVPFSYEVIETKVVKPDETEEIRAVPGEDLATLITCTPLGINTHRHLVTGERIYPTPQGDIDAAGQRPTVPHFPWWAVAYGVTITALTVWYWRSGYSTPSKRGEKRKLPAADQLQ